MRKRERGKRREDEREVGMRERWKRREDVSEVEEKMGERWKRRRERGGREQSLSDVLAQEGPHLRVDDHDAAVRNVNGLIRRHVRVPIPEPLCVYLNLEGTKFRLT